MNAYEHQKFLSNLDVWEQKSLQCSYPNLRTDGGTETPTENNKLNETNFVHERQSIQYSENQENMEIHSMKFPKPKQLLINEYPDIIISNPDLI